MFELKSKYKIQMLSNKMSSIKIKGFSSKKINSSCKGKTNFKEKTKIFDDCCICFNSVEKLKDNIITCGKTNHIICGDCKVKMKGEKPSGKPILKMKGYTLYENGELWKTGKHGYRAGYVMNKNEEGMEIAIENHEEEMRVEYNALLKEFL